VLHRDRDIGRNKTRSARETINRINPLVTVETLEDHIVKDNVSQLVGSADIIVDCMDNFSTATSSMHMPAQQAFPLFTRE